MTLTQESIFYKFLQLKIEKHILSKSCSELILKVK